jgi:alpha-glucuronidase
MTRAFLPKTVPSLATRLRVLSAILALTFAAGCSTSGTGDSDESSVGAGGSAAGAGGGSQEGGGGDQAGGGGTVANAGGASGNAGGASGNAGGAPANAGGSLVGVGGSMLGSDEDYPAPITVADESGAELWLRFPEVPIPGRLSEYQAALSHVVNAASSETLTIAATELVDGLRGLTSMAITLDSAVQGAGAVVIGTPDSSPEIASLPLVSRLTPLGPEGYLVETADVGGQTAIVVAGNSDVGVLYGSYALLRHLSSHATLEGLALSGTPKIEHRVLNHWDNLDGSVERGYAGSSLWNWGALPGTLSPRYTEYARANASIGINGTVLTNVNADAQVLTASYLDKVRALADVFRPYGIKVYLTARFSAPSEIGGQSTADPANAGVQQWWADKADEIYALIPDFGGFLVKANSEGQPGPQDYGRTHADGANMLADAVAPHGGIVMWRAFVYAEDAPVDRIREAYDEFKPLDGQFRDNVLVQPKNGPLDFQPREPFHPLFGGMPETPLALELQVTKEYLGQDTHLAYVGPWYEEVLKADTYASGAGSTVARVVDGSLHSYSTTAIAGVANIGNDTNWTGSQFNQANWYAYGRMAWDPDLSATAVAEEWVRQTLSNDPLVVGPVTTMMMDSHQALVNYMTPLGLAHIMASTHHYGPGPWVSDLDRPEWNPVYYHKADAQGLGFDRTAAGSNAVEQYFSEVGETFGDRSTVPDDFLLFFHHVGWSETLGSGRTLWEELVHRYSLGVDAVQTIRDAWASVEGRVDNGRFAEISDFLQIQHYEARWWRDACLTYFDTFADQGIPAGYAQPANSLSFYQGLTCPQNRDKPRCPAIETGEPSPTILP